MSVSRVSHKRKGRRWASDHRHTVKAKGTTLTTHREMRPLTYIRIGEASHPGPIRSMPGDGHCLYHALGWWDGNPQGEVRRTIARISREQWSDICPWDDGSALVDFRAQTTDMGEWGGALQIAAMARIRGVAILVHTDFGLQVFGHGPSWHIRHNLNPGHYDVIEPDQHQQGEEDDSARGAKGNKTEAEADGTKNRTDDKHDGRKAMPAEEGKQDRPRRPLLNKGEKTTLGGKREATVLTINVGGSREALGNAFQAKAHILLIQEHRLTGPDIPGMQGLAAMAGWHGVWDEAVKTFAKGRSGGTAVLVRKPLIIHRGPKVHRGTLAAVAWTRRNYLHVGSVYGAHQGHPARAEENHKLFTELQEHLAAIGRVPWVIGGDWNMEPQEFHQGWAKGGTITHTGGPPTSSEGTSIGSCTASRSPWAAPLGRWWPVLTTPG